MNNLSHQFLCSCFRLDGDAWTQIGSWDWEQLFAEASEEALLPALYSRVRDLGINEFLPQPIADFLCSVESLNAERNDAILAELKLAVRLLHGVGIEPILLKGVAYLATGVYATPAARYLADIDLLIPEKQITQAAQVLMQHEFEVEDNAPFARFRHHHPPLKRPGAVHIELHRTLTMSRADMVLPARDMIQSCITADLDGLSVRVPCPTHMMVHLIMHSQLQHPYNERIWPPIKAMYDLALLQFRFQEEIDWSFIERRFTTAGHHRTLALHLLQVGESLGFRTPLRVQLTAGLRIAWNRRKLLRRSPRLRYLDPAYMFSVTIGRRWRIMAKILQTPGGLRYLSGEFRKADIYQSFFEDMVRGRGH
jgi:Uncharacterised nucleotidyltransferase